MNQIDKYREHIAELTNLLDQEVFVVWRYRQLLLDEEEERRKREEYISTMERELDMRGRRILELQAAK